jgi:sn-glycerol 3-phosphate transport system substrate-binding protein
MLVFCLVAAACTSDRRGAQPSATSLVHQSVAQPSTTITNAPQIVTGPPTTPSLTNPGTIPPTPTAAVLPYTYPASRFDCDVTNVPSTGPVTELTLWSDLGGLPGVKLAELVAEFNHTNPAIHVNLAEHQPTGDVALLDLMQTGEPADVMIANDDALVNLRDSGRLTTAQSCIDHDPTFNAAEILPLARLAYVLDGQQIAVPVAASLPILAFDRKVWRAGGIPDEVGPPRNMQELRSILSTLHDSGVAAKGLVFADASWFILDWATQLDVSLVSGNNGRSGTTNHVYLSNIALIDVLGELGRLANDGLVTKTENNIDNNSGAADLFEVTIADPQHRAAMAIHSSGALGAVFQVTDGTLYEPEVGPMPGPGRNNVVGGSAAWLTTNDPAKVAASWTFMRFLTEAHAQAVFATQGYAPVRAAALDDQVLKDAWKQHPGLRVAYDEAQIESPSPGQFGAMVAVQSEFRLQLLWAVERIYRDQQDPKESLLIATDVTNALLDKYYQLRQNDS